MTDVPDAAERALEDHRAFEPIGDEDSLHDDGSIDGIAHEVTTTPFDAVVVAEPTDAEGRDAAFDVRVDVPTLDAVVGGETVADVVEDGWLDTFELRLEDAYDVAEVDPLADETVTREDDVVHTRFRFEAWDAASGVDDAKAIVDYVEGTYVQGVIPGYEYEEPVAGLLARATETAGGEDEGATRGGTPL